VNVSDVFFADLGLPSPDRYLNVGSNTHARQTAAVMVAFKDVLLNDKPDLPLVYGDVNSTVAAALVSEKLHVPAPSPT
jgi:UDP-N-acetylglucosamine 2-epimerase (non-hydrolysing)